MKRLKNSIPFLFVGIILGSGCTSEVRGPATAGGASLTPARPVVQAGCPNLYRVSEVLYRSAQPEKECFPYLERLGIRTVIDLRMFHSDEKELEGTSLAYISISMAPWDPKGKQVREFLRIATDPAYQPVLLHCRHGADRTGTLIAAWRMVVEGWSKERAIEEMTKGPFGYHKFWSGLPKFLETLDVEALRKEFVRIP